MIEFDYVLVRDEGTRTTTFKPNEIASPLPNLALIEGPNASGKSTLLNVLALAFYGLKTPRLNAALREKIRDLVQSDHQRLKFRIKISDEEGRSILEAVKDDPERQDIVVKEYDGERAHILSAEAFQRKYNLIYDIPDNPIERLAQLVVEIREVQNHFANRVGSMKNTILRYVTEIKAAGDPKLVEKLTLTIAANQEQAEKQVTEKERYEQVLTLLEKYRIGRAFAQAFQDYTRVQGDLEEAQTELERAKKQAKKVDSKARQRRNAVIQEVEEMKQRHRSLASNLKYILPKDEKDRLDLWDRIDFDSALRQRELPDLPWELVRHFRGILQKMIDGNRAKMTEAKIFTELLTVLRKYRDSDVVIPGVQKPVIDFIEMLEKVSDEYESARILQERIYSAFEEFDKLDQDRRELGELLTELGSLGDSTVTEDSSEVFEEEELARVVRLQDEFAAAETKCQHLGRECVKVGLNPDDVHSEIDALASEEALSSYLPYDEDELRKASEHLRADIATRSERLKRLQLDIEIRKADLARLEKKEPHRFQKMQPQLEDLLEKCQALEQKLSRQYAGYLDKLSQQRAIAPSSSEEKKYFDAAGQYLGRKLKRVRHVDREYEVVTVDFPLREIRTKEGVRIRLSDMGTGQSQSAYLQGLLNSDDDRIIMALFDEVAMMDSKSLKPILRRLNELSRAKKLILGVVVQRADEVRVAPIPRLD